MVWNTPYSVRLLKHIAHPSSTSTCVWNDGWVKAGSRHCRTGSREGMLVNMDGDLLVLCSRLRRLKPRTVYKEPRPLFIIKIHQKICERSGHGALVFRPASEIAVSGPLAPALRAQLQPRGTWPKGHRQELCLSGVVAVHDPADRANYRRQPLL